MKEELQQILTEYASVFNAFFDIENWKLVILGDVNTGQDLAAVCASCNLNSGVVVIDELWVLT
ncbi:MAG: hypothetical protein K2J20_05000 [Bacilli bacterium]|nr:hypothetical protein [Bacilli bacterium]